jgi:hypothetical protein
MLFHGPFLEGVSAGKFSLAFRRWTHARVKPGTRLRTQVGVLEVLDVTEIHDSEIADRDARLAGYENRTALLADLSDQPGRQLYRVKLKYAGADERISLRENAKLSADDFAAIHKKLLGYERAGAWTRQVLELIAENEARRAPALAKIMNMETLLFKRRVRQLKELGLTESLGVGYRISPRGKTYLKLLKKQA